MKKITKKGLGLVVLSAFAFAPIASYAQLNSNLSGDIVVETNNPIDANLDTSVKTDSSINSDSSVDGSIDLNLGNDYEKDNDFKDEGIDSKASLKVNSNGVAIVSSSQVNSESDLNVFSANVSIKDKQVSEVNVDSGNKGESMVEVTYRHKGKLLGFIPVTVKSKTVVEVKSDTKTEVHSKLPWWSFLVIKKNYAKADIESRIKSNNTIRQNAKVNASSQEKAQIAEAVIAEVAADANAQASINK